MYTWLWTVKCLCGTVNFENKNCRWKCSYSLRAQGIVMVAWSPLRKEPFIWLFRLRYVHCPFIRLQVLYTVLTLCCHRLRYVHCPFTWLFRVRHVHCPFTWLFRLRYVHYPFTWLFRLRYVHCPFIRLQVLYTVLSLCYHRLRYVHCPFTWLFRLRYVHCPFIRLQVLYTVLSPVSKTHLRAHYT